MTPDTVRLELINGKIEVKPVPDGDHDEIIRWLQKLCLKKRDAYAAAEIPVYLLIDPEDCTATVHSEPKDGSYRSLTSRPYGMPVELPAPVGFTLETEQLKKFAD
ncbi:Uma2 family endonuclease [Streptomyces sp. NPDC026206]|uniref:Uma2 family endonuclease n=1 Tax=Streptomyces sp. NPDC026206 TaxID=3157089 RepID=UPI0033CC72FB